MAQQAALGAPGTVIAANPMVAAGAGEGSHALGAATDRSPGGAMPTPFDTILSKSLFEAAAAEEGFGALQMRMGVEALPRAQLDASGLPRATTPTALKRG